MHTTPQLKAFLSHGSPIAHEHPHSTLQSGACCTNVCATPDTLLGAVQCPIHLSVSLGCSIRNFTLYERHAYQLYKTRQGWLNWVLTSLIALSPLSPCHFWRSLGREYCIGLTSMEASGLYHVTISGLDRTVDERAMENHLKKMGIRYKNFFAQYARGPQGSNVFNVFFETREEAERCVKILSANNIGETRNVVILL